MQTNRSSSRAAAATRRDAQLTPAANNQKHSPCSSRRRQQRRRRQQQRQWNAKKCVEIHAQLHLSCLEDCFAKVRLKVLAVTADIPPPPHTHTLCCYRVCVQRNTEISRVLFPSALCLFLIRFQGAATAPPPKTHGHPIGGDTWALPHFNLQSH